MRFPERIAGMRIGLWPPPRAAMPAAARPEPTRTARVAVALAVGVAAALYVVACWRRWPDAVRDLDQCWWAAKILRAGGNPYALIGPGRPWPSRYDWPYPLPAAVVLWPFASHGLLAARVFVVSLGATLLAYGATRDGWWRLWLFASGPAVFAAWSAQWSFLLAAGLVVAPAGAAWAAKPNIGAALFVARPSRAALVGIGLLLAASFLVWPGWVGPWLANTRTGMSHIVAPVFQPGGALLLLAALRWRRPEARLLLAMACVRQNVAAYEVLPLLLVPGSRTELVALCLLSTGAVWLQMGPLHDYDPLGTLALCYLPCLVIVLRRPNDGAVPAWIERTLGAVRRQRTRAPRAATAHGGTGAR